MILVTDLNHRDRKRYAEMMDKMAIVCRELAISLRDENDNRAVLYLSALAYAGNALPGLFEAFEKASSVEIPDTAPEK